MEGARGNAFEVPPFGVTTTKIPFFALDSFHSHSFTLVYGALPFLPQIDKAVKEEAQKETLLIGSWSFDR